MMDILWFVIKALGGTCLFTLILWYAQSQHPRAAGMMLTFPALNGIGLLTAESADVLRMASAMIPMIATNGFLCASYIIMHRRLAPLLSRLSLVTQVVGVLGAGLGLWLVMAQGVMPHLPLHAPGPMAVFVLAYGISIWPLTTRVLWRPIQPQPAGHQGLLAVVRANPAKVCGVFLLLAAVMLVAHLGADTWAGRLSTVPILPLYSLAMIPAGTPGPQQRIVQLDQLGGTVLLGPLVAMAFVGGFGSYLALLQQYTSGALYWASGILGVLAGWSLCAGIIRMVVSLGSLSATRQTIQSPEVPRSTGRKP